jgi:hypothetical protein
MKNLKIYSIIAAALLTCSCNFLDMTPNIISKETFYQNSNDVKYGLAGVYGAMNSEAFYGNYYSLMISNSDDLSYYNRSVTSSLVQMYTHDASTAEIYSAWVQIYAGIRNANAFMNAMKNSDLDKDHKYYNEARFLRAYYHFILAQAWGDVPLRSDEVTDHDGVMIAATPQYDVLTWVASEMTDCLALADTAVTVQPSRITRTTIDGILARVYLFMAGSSVTGGDKKAFFKEAMDHAGAVIATGKHHLNPSYKQVFINMISDKYDTDYHESMWECEFLGDRSTPSYWSNGRIGDLIGLQSTGSSNFSTFNCNYSYAMYNGSLKLWDLYWTNDRTDDETQLPTVTDARQDWNMCPYNYSGSTKNPPYGTDGSNGKKTCDASIDKTPYAYDSKTTTQDPTTAQAIRNCGKYRREVEYEGVKEAKMLYTSINYPILRYSDVLLMYAEAQNEYDGAPSQLSYDYVKQVRDRAGIKTKDFSTYDYSSFQTLVRNERGRELCFESLRKYDLIRWGIFVSEMHKYGEWAADTRWSNNALSQLAATVGGSVQDRDIVLPIPTIELGVNNLLVQNPLW